MSLSKNAERLVESLITLSGVPATLGEPRTTLEVVYDTLAHARRMVISATQLTAEIDGDWMETVPARCSMVEASAYLEHALSQMSLVMERRAAR